jgi:hypothetical protein
VLGDGPAFLGIVRSTSSLSQPGKFYNIIIRGPLEDSL